MNNINISLNKILLSRLKERVKGGGYSNVSEYIRDLLRQDLGLTKISSISSGDNYPYDYGYIEKLALEAAKEHQQSKTKLLKSVDELDK